jgi:hypothetical protein
MNVFKKKKGPKELVSSAASALAEGSDEVVAKRLQAMKEVSETYGGVSAPPCLTCADASSSFAWLSLPNKDPVRI